MSSDLPKVKHKKSQSWSVALRTTAGVVTLVSVVLVTLAAVMVTVAGRVVDSRLREQTEESWQRTAGFMSVPWRAEADQPDSQTQLREPLNAPGLPIDAITVIVDSAGAVTTASRFDAEGSLTDLSEADSAQLSTLARSYQDSDSTSPQVHRVSLESGNYLVMVGYVDLTQRDPLGTSGQTSAQSASQDDSAILIVGLSASQSDRTKANLLAVQAVGAVVAVGLVGVGVWWWIRRSLRPLHEVSQAAVRVAGVPMSTGNVDLEQYRVPDALAAAKDEVGDVGRALNQLIGSVDTALEARSTSEHRLRAFVADASHELRTPLAAVQGYADMIRLTEGLSESGQDMLQRVLQQSKRMSSLVENLLLLARLDAVEAARLAGQTPPMLVKELDIVELVVDAVTDATAAGRDHHWVADLPDEPVNVLGDRVQLSQLFANLLSNARKHTPAGTEVRVRMRNEGSQIVIDVIDNGPGIKDELVNTLFDRFVRGDTARTSSEGSTGLGLSIAQSVARAHGGDIAVRSRPGKTVFSVTLPIRLTSSADE